MYAIFKLVKTAGRHPHQKSWTLTHVAKYPSREEAELSLMILTTTDTDPSSEWNIRKMCDDITYDAFMASRHNYHHRKYFLISKEYTISDLEKELKEHLAKDGITIV